MLKPFSFSELATRVRALLKRSARLAENLLRLDDLVLNRVEHSVRRANRPIELTPKEYSLLEFMMRNTGRRVTRFADYRARVEPVARYDDERGGVYVNYSSAQVDQRKV